MSLKQWFTKITLKNGQLPAINDDTLNNIQNNINDGIDTIINNIFPVGKVEIFFDNADYSNYMGFTWEKVAEGKMLVGVGTGTDKNSVSKTFSVGNNTGEYEHTQTKDEVGTHNHMESDNTALLYHSGINKNVGTGDTSIGRVEENKTNSSSFNDSGIYTHNNTRSSGVSSTKAMNITNPTYGVYIWKRIS